ncbi:hypothetical protein KJ652_03235 [Patescibacteria group bacterium]|nr:hypothetical protein [Patescibacteria group bacterium]
METATSPDALLLKIEQQLREAGIDPHHIEGDVLHGRPIQIPQGADSNVRRLVDNFASAVQGTDII